VINRYRPSTSASSG